jgi:methionyl aminopeptidase
VVRGYSGHGIGHSLHENLPVPNYGPTGWREILTPGMTPAIEPLVNAGSPETRVLADGGPVVTMDDGLSVHFEHTGGHRPEGA